MALQHPHDAPKGPQAGDVLLVIHDFAARSPDELSLTKGDRIELLEKDDEFGDGWYLGKMITTGVSGLFPEVYTTIAPQGPAASQPRSNGMSAATVAPAATAPQAPSSAVEDSEISPRTQDFSPGASAERPKTPKSPQPSTLSETESARVAPLNTGSSPQRVASLPYNTYSASPMAVPASGQRSISMVMQNSHSREDSPVMHETLNVIDEHITDMSTPRSSVIQRVTSHDSGSDYSNHVNVRASYVHGDESDEDERMAFSEEEVVKWTSDEAARYLESIGVDRKHCEIFKEQEISGDILMNMDQSTLFMKEFDLGVVGRRLRTWHKIRAFQEGVRSQKDVNSRAGDFFDEPEFATGSQGSGSRLPRIPSLVNRQSGLGSPQAQRQDNAFARPASQMRNDSAIFGRGADTVGDRSRASRRHSSIDFKVAHPSMLPNALDTTPPQTGSLPHRKQPSLDREWSLAAATAAAVSPEFLSPEIPAIGSTTPRSERQLSIEEGKAEELDRGYTSGGDLDMRKNRNVLRKKDTPGSSHSRQSSFRDDHGNLTVHNKRHSRFGSAGSIRDTITSIASGGRLRAQSTKEPASSLGTKRDHGPPLVTKLDYPTDSRVSAVRKQNFLIAKSKFESLSRDEEDVHENEAPKLGKAPGLASSLTMTSFFEYKADKRSFSEQATANSSTNKTSGEKTPVNSPNVMSPMADSTTAASSPSRTTSAAASTKAQSIESADSIRNLLTQRSSQGGKPARPKHKTKTSAYTRGLRKVSPMEALKDCDYSGWMKKKSPGLMTIWRPRLFILQGRRLGYYYAEDDTEERGLIDISNHRVLPAEKDYLATMHKNITRATTTPTSPANASLETKNDIEAAAIVDKSSLPAKSPKLGSGENSMFVFKLVPPRTGLSKAVQFTKPAIHYFATDNVKQGRLWMAALMKATIDRDPDAPITSTYQQKTISLSKAKAMRQRPPALMGVDEERAKQADEQPQEPDKVTVTDTTPDVGSDGAPATWSADSQHQSATGVGHEAGGLGIEGLDFKPESLMPTVAEDGKRTESPGRPSLRLVRSMSGGLSNSGKGPQRTLSDSSKLSSKAMGEAEETTQ